MARKYCTVEDVVSLMPPDIFNVGTAITGCGNKPPAIEGNAPSIPAITIITSALSISSFTLKNLWIPATPISAWSCVDIPEISRISCASLAVLMSEVPAVIIETRPFFFSAGVMIFFKLEILSSSKDRALRHQEQKWVLDLI